MVEQQSFLKAFLIHRPRTSPAVPPTSVTETIISGSIVVLTSAIAAALSLLPHEVIKGSRVPTTIFKGMPSTFRAFVASVMLAFAGAFCALFAHNKPKIARLCRYYSTVSIAFAVALAISASSSQPS